MYVLSKQRGVGAVGAFRQYRIYLSENASRFPPSAYELATSDWYFDFSDHRCPHDAWLESATLHEPSTGSRHELRSLTLKLRLLGAYHDGFIELEYPEVQAYELVMPYTAQGQGDWRYDEFRVADSGRVIHEIEWATFGQSGRWLIEAADVIYKWTDLHHS
jgi:hypothetical protein